MLEAAELASLGKFLSGSRGLKSSIENAPDSYTILRTYASMIFPQPALEKSIGDAIDLDTGDYAWKIPLGEYPELVQQGLTNTGSENYGGPIVTAGGLVFIAATNHDRKIRAFDKATGALLWEAMLPSSGNATPATYEVNGRQYLVVAASGGKSKTGGPGGLYVAFGLPR